MAPAGWGVGRVGAHEAWYLAPFQVEVAMERNGLELRDVAHARGWKDLTTLVDVYQQPDPETPERVVTGRRKLREA